MKIYLYSINIIHCKLIILAIIFPATVLAKQLIITSSILLVIVTITQMQPIMWQVDEGLVGVGIAKWSFSFPSKKLSFFPAKINISF